MDIYLIRHGESIMNTGENRTIKEIDSKIRITETGRKQAEKSAKFLDGYLQHEYIRFPKNARVWLSPYQRTRETFQEFDKIIGFKEKCQVYEDILLAEQEFGLFDAIAEEDRQKLFPNEFEYYNRLRTKSGKFYARCPMGESPKDVAIRCRMFFDTIYRDYDKHGIDALFIFTHGTVLRAFTMAWQHYSPEWYETEHNPGNCWIRRICNHNDYGYIYKER